MTDRLAPVTPIGTRLQQVHDSLRVCWFATEACQLEMCDLCSDPERCACDCHPEVAE